MNDLPLVSIVIPVYNGANFLSQAIESALAQNYPFVEVIVVDDGSTDSGATRAVAEGFGGRIRYLWKTNGGVATALNLGIANMRGRLFSWLSHDDLYKPDKVSSQVDTWRRFGRTCIVIGDSETMDEAGNPLARVRSGGRNLVARPTDAIFEGLINGCALMVPRELFDEVGTFEPGLPTTQDYHLWYRMARVAPLVHCPRADTRHRVHALQGSLTPAHIHEAGRLFIHLIHETPPSMMEACEGSELRFLMRLRKRIPSYPGVQPYLASRIRNLFRQFAYSVVLCSDGAEPPAEAVERLRSFDIPPANIAMAGVLVPPGARVCDVVCSAHAAACGEAVLFLRASRLPSEASIRDAIERLIEAEADVLRPRWASPPPLLSPLDGLIVRRAVLPMLGAAMKDFAPDWDSLSRELQIAEYEMPELPVIQTPEELLEAFAGKARLDYHCGLSEGAIAELLAGALNPALPTILFLSPSGTLLRGLYGNVNCLTAYRANSCIHLSLGSLNRENGLVFRHPEQLAILIRILHKIGLARVDVHHAAGFDTEAETLLGALGLPFDLTLTDYHPAPLLVLRNAERVIATCRDLAARTGALCPGLPLISAEWPGESKLNGRHVFINHPLSNEPLRVLGAGGDIILEVALIVARRNLPIRFHVMGKIQMHDEVRAEIGRALTAHGRFKDGAFFDALGRIDPHIGWLPVQAPETRNLVLSELMEAGLPIASNAIGCIPERCHGRPTTWLFPWDTNAAAWVEFLLRLRETGLREPPRWADVSHLPPARPFYFEEYLKPLTV